MERTPERWPQLRQLRRVGGGGREGVSGFDASLAVPMVMARPESVVQPPLPVPQASLAMKWNM